MAQENLRKLIHLMELLMYNDRMRRDTRALAQKVGVSQRTIQRMLNTLDVSGFVLDRLGRGIYSLRRDEGKLKELSRAMYFTEEEAFILARLIASLKGESPIKNNLYEKIQRFFSTPRLADLVVNLGIGECLGQLQEAIDLKRCAILHEYKSANRNIISNRKVEPYRFTTNYNAVVCFDYEDFTCKTFTLARIGWVEILDDPWRHESEHKELHIDLFRNSADKPIGRVTLRLSTRAYNLLKEEYPLAESFIKGDPPQAIFDAEVNRYEGPARFVLGLANEVHVIGDQGFKAFLRDRLDEMNKKYLEENEND